MLAVRVDQSKDRNRRWYAGSGIYRHAWLHVTDPVYVAPWGVCVTTPEVSATRAKLSVKSRIVNEPRTQSNLVVQTTIYTGFGASPGRSNSSAEPK